MNEGQKIVTKEKRQLEEYSEVLYEKELQAFRERKMLMVKMVIGEVQTQTEQIKFYGKTYSQALELVSTATQ